MARKIYALVFFAFLSNLPAVFAQSPQPAGYDAIIMYPSAPNPTGGKCLIRTYLPDADPNASIRILLKDSTLYKEIPLGGQFGVGSTPLNVSDWKADTFLYQLFYHGETKMTRSFVVKH